MNRMMMYCTALLFSLLAYCSISDQFSGDVFDTPNDVTGYVVLDNGEPAGPGYQVNLFAVSITLTGDTITETHSATTDAKSKFLFPQVKKGQYILYCDTDLKSGYRRVHKGASPLEAGVLTLRRKMVIVGRALGTTGIFACLPALQRNITVTDSGVFRLTQVPAGSYEIAFIRQGVVNYLPVTVTASDDTVFLQDFIFITESTPQQEVQIYHGALSSFWVKPQHYALENMPSWYAGKNFTGADYYTLDTAGVPVKPDTLYTARFVINTTANGAGVQEDVIHFPLLIRLDASVLSFGQAETDGSDIRCTDQSRTTIPHEFEVWDYTKKEAVVWVRVPLIKGNNEKQFIAVHWGANASLLPQAKSPVFDTTNGFVGVWHLDPGLKDATAHANHGIDSGTVTADGIIGYCRNFIPQNQTFITIPNESLFDLTKNITLSAWVRVDTFTIKWQPMVCKGDYTYRLQRFLETSGASFCVSVNDGTNYYDIGSKTAVDDHAWYFLCGIYDGNRAQMYVNGILEADSLIRLPLQTTNAPVRIGANLTYPDERRFFDGLIDEVRISKQSRSPSWIKLCYENQKKNQRLVYRLLW